MSYSVVQNPSGPVWPLGFIQVPTIGTPVGLMSLVDANSTGAPWFSPSNATPGPEYTPTTKSIWLGGFQPAANNNGLIPNQGQIYVNLNPGNANGYNNNCNRSDPGSLVSIVQPGTWVPIPQSLSDSGTRFSPYQYTIDGDNNNDGVIAVLVGSRT